MHPQAGGGARLGLGGYKSDGPMDWENNVTGARLRAFSVSKR
jgi:hypothetical protein